MLQKHAMYISRMQIFMNSYRSQHLYFYDREEEMAIILTVLDCWVNQKRDENKNSNRAFKTVLLDRLIA